MWGTAFFQQAKSDWNAFKEIQNLGLDDCHKLYYLRAATEKLGKAALLKSGVYSIDDAAIYNHKLFVKYLQHIPKNIKLCKALGQNPTQSKQYINSIFSLATSIQNLAPGKDNPGANAEYPWEVSGVVYVPAHYEFIESHQLGTPDGRKLLKLIQFILDNFESIY